MRKDLFGNELVGERVGSEWAPVLRRTAETGQEAHFTRRGQEGEEAAGFLAAYPPEKPGMIAPGNEWLAERAAQGDATAFEYLAERCKSMLTAYARSCVSNWADAQDVVQDTLLDAFLGLPRFDKARPFEPWLRAICRNRVRKHWRRGKREESHRSSLSDLVVALEAERLGTGCDDTEGREEGLGRVYECLRRLKDEHRDLLLWRYGEDLSVSEVARRSGRSPGNVAQTLYRLRQALRGRVASIG